MTQFSAPSGVVVVINAAPWVDAKRLKMAIEKEVKLDGGFDLDKDAATLITMLLQTDGSVTVDAALLPCLARCTRDGHKITEQTFDDVLARKDYYAIVAACLRENLSPLVEGLLSELAKVIPQVRKQASATSDSPK